MATAVMVVIAGKIESTRVGAVRAKTDLTRMMNVASIDPDFTTLSQSKSVAPPSDLHTSQAKMMHRFALADVENVLFRIRRVRIT